MDSTDMIPELESYQLGAGLTGITYRESKRLVGMGSVRLDVGSNISCIGGIPFAINTYLILMYCLAII